MVDDHYSLYLAGKFICVTVPGTLQVTRYDKDDKPEKVFVKDLRKGDVIDAREYKKVRLGNFRFDKERRISSIDLKAMGLQE